MSVVLAVIPNRSIDKDVIINNFLVNKSKDPRIEIAQHGTNHIYEEYALFSENEGYNAAKVGLDKLIEVLNVYPVTFIPPNNILNESVINIISKLGFIIISDKQGEYIFNKNISRIGFDVATAYSGNTSSQNKLVLVNNILMSCNNSLKDKNICVIMIHPQDYVSNDGKTLNETKYVEFIKLLDWLQGLNAKLPTFNDLEVCTDSE